MTDMALEAVDLSEHRFTPVCEFEGAGTTCDQPATLIAKGCMDQQPVLMCDEHLDLCIERVKTVVHLYQQLNKKVMVCGNCYRPIISLDTHLEVRRL